MHIVEEYQILNLIKYSLALSLVSCLIIMCLSVNYANNDFMFWKYVNLYFTLVFRSLDVVEMSA